MFREVPGSSAWLLPGYGPARVMYEGAFSSSFNADLEPALGIGWLVAVGAAVYVVLRRGVAPDDGTPAFAGVPYCACGSTDP
jgi:hypothetical protein